MSQLEANNMFLASSMHVQYGRWMTPTCSVFFSSQPVECYFLKENKHNLKRLNHIENIREFYV